MHDIRLIRDDPQAFDAALARRGVASLSHLVLELDKNRRANQTALQEGMARRNQLSKEFGEYKRKGSSPPTNLIAELNSLKRNLPQGDQEELKFGAQIHELLSSIPNLPDADIPDGAHEEDNVEVSRWGTRRQFTFEPKEHADLGPALGLDFETGALISGARFTFLRGQMARLQRALGQFMLDKQTGEHGYTECAPPLLVRDEAVFGTGQLPKFADDLFRTTDGRWLIPTAEVSLTNSVREQILAESALPILLTALTPCFRSEAGAAGKDTRGYIRQHQFDKVELVTICRPVDSAAEHERMTTAAESILQALDLPYRKMLLCAGDMGFTARKTYDLEVWLPGQGAYREISSISNCGDFQARRMNARFKPSGAGEGFGTGGFGRGPFGTSTVFLHTLNGSGLAVGRTLVAVLENCQQADGSVEVPAVLHPYMGGITRLTATA